MAVKSDRQGLRRRSMERVRSCLDGSDEGLIESLQDLHMQDGDYLEINQDDIMTISKTVLTANQPEACKPFLIVLAKALRSLSLPSGTVFVLIP